MNLCTLSLVAGYLMYCEGAYMHNVYQVLSTKEHSRVKRAPLAGKRSEVNMQEVNSIFGLSSRNGYLEKTDSITTAQGTERVKLVQMINSIPIYAAGCTIEVSHRGQTMGIASGTVMRGVHRDVKPSDFLLTPTHALQILKSENGHTKATHTFSNERSSKMIYLKDGDVWPSWKVYYMAYGNEETIPDERPFALIYDHNSSIIMQWAGLENITIDGVGGNHRSGLLTHKMDVFQNIQEGVEVCYYKSSKVEVMDMEGELPADRTEFLVRGFECSAAKDSVHFDQVMGSYSPLNDVYTYAMFTHDMFMETIGRSPLGKGTSNIIKIRSHVKPCMDNAFWDGEYVNVGYGCQLFYPLVSADIIAHEIAHGYTEHTSGLAYQKQSGGIDEAFSDITGEAVEYYYRLKTGQAELNDWKIGSDISKNQRPMRYMCDPPKDGMSIDRLSKYMDGYNVHFTSGIFNKAYCILSNTPNWDPLKAFKVFAIANQIEWTPDVTFNCAACGLINAAVAEGYNANDVIKALEEVEVNCGMCTSP